MTATAQQHAAGDAPPEPAGRRRLAAPPLRNGHWGWTGPLLVTAIGAVLRFWSLGTPARLMVDETYYAKDAWAMLHSGVGRQWPTAADAQIAAGRAVPVPTDPSFVVHPEIGKWIIAAGEKIFGLTPFGWRVGVAVVGSLTVLLVCRIARRLLGSTLLGCVAGLLVALDGLSIVMSRVAFLDGPLTFFVLAAFGCLLLDRDRSRAAYDAWADGHPNDGHPNDGHPNDGHGVDPRALRWGPRLLWRPWRLAAGVLLGLAAGTKWSGAYALVVFGLLSVLWDAAARRALGVQAARLKALLVDVPMATLTVAGSAVLAYLASWSGWLSTGDGWSRQWAATRPAVGLAAALPDWLRSLWHYHAEILAFHRGLDTPHDYASSPWGWLVLSRPFLVDYVGHDAGTGGCAGPGRCSETVLALGTPAFWWAGVAALVVCVWMWAARRDWRAGAVLAGVAATYLPWFLLLDRTIFSWYAVAIAPFVAMALALVAGLLLGPPGSSVRRRRIGALVVGGYLLLVVANAAYFWPIWTAQVIPYEAWQHRMWIPRWV